MMLDMKRTFDEVVESPGEPGEGAGRSSPTPSTSRCRAPSPAPRSTWRWRSSASCAQDARPAGRWDLIVVDTPPARSALDFLDAPERLSGFLDGRFIRLLLAPAKGPARLMTAGVGAVTNTMAKIVGAQVLKDLQMFVAAFDTLFGGFRNRAQQTYEMLQTQETAFLVVAAPEPDALREAAYFVERLDAEHMPLAGLVVNRATLRSTGSRRAGGGRGRGAARGRPARRASRHGATAGLLRLHADRMRRVGAASSGCVGGSRPPTRTCRRWSCRRCPPTCTTSTGCGGSASCSPADTSGGSDDPGGRQADSSRWCDQALTTFWRRRCCSA